MNRKDYAPEWQDIIRPAILKRDNYTCSDCGIRHRSRVYRKSNGGYHVCDAFTEEWAVNNGRKVFTLYLQVAHLDHNKLNNEASNLLSKCPRCHSIYDQPHKSALRNMVLASKPNPIIEKANNFKTLADEKHFKIQAFIKQETGQTLSKESIFTLITLILK